MQYREMTDNILYRIPDEIYEKFFRVNVLLNRLPSQEESVVRKSDSSSDEAESKIIDQSYEYYIENKYIYSENINCVSANMITRSSWKKINSNLSTDCLIKPLESIPKIVIKKKFIKPNGKIKVGSSKLVKLNNNNPKTSSVNRAKKEIKRKRPIQLPKRKVLKPQASTIVEDNAVTIMNDLVVPKCEVQSAEQSTRTVETGYSSAAESSTNEPTLKNTEDEISRPILNYTLIPKPKRGRHCKNCCLDFVILPPIDLTVPYEKRTPIVKTTKGRPRNSIGAPKVIKPKQKPKVSEGEKKPRKKYVLKKKLKALNLTTPLNSDLPVVTGKSLPILEWPQDVTPAISVKEKLMAHDFMCRVPLSKIIRIPRVIKVQIPSIKQQHHSQQNTELNNKHITNAIQPEPEQEPPTVSDINAIPEFVKETTTVESINDWFPTDLDLSSLNETNYNQPDMVLEDEYFPKNTSFTSTPCPNQTNQPIESYMADKLATETLPDISFGSTLFNYTEPTDNLVTPIKLPPPPPQLHYSGSIDNPELKSKQNPQILDFSFKRPLTKFSQTTDAFNKQYSVSPAPEPLDLSFRKCLSPTQIKTCNPRKYTPSLSPQMGEDVLLLDASYLGMESTPPCNSSERVENNPPSLDNEKRVGNRKLDDFLCDMDAIAQEQDQYNPTNSQLISACPTLMIKQNYRPPITDIEKPNQLPYNGILVTDVPTLNHRINQIFNFPCFRFLSGKCFGMSCRFSHALIESRVLQTILQTESIAVINRCYNFTVKYDILFNKYFDMFCYVFGKNQMIESLTMMIRQCERGDRPIGFYRHIISGLVLCKLDYPACYAILVKNLALISSKTIDIMIQIMLDLDVVLQFTDKLEKFLKTNSYRININLFDRMLNVGKCTKDPELIRILLETINSYPSDCQRRLNSSMLTQFLQMVRNLQK